MLIIMLKHTSECECLFPHKACGLSAERHSLVFVGFGLCMSYTSPMNSPRIRRSTSSSDSILDRDPEDLKKEAAQYRSIGYLGIVFIVSKYHGTKLELS